MYKQAGPWGTPWTFRGNAEYVCGAWIQGCRGGGRGIYDETWQDASVTETMRIVCYMVILSSIVCVEIEETGITNARIAKGFEEDENPSSHKKSRRRAPKNCIQASTVTVDRRIHRNRAASPSSTHIVREKRPTRAIGFRVARVFRIF